MTPADLVPMRLAATVAHALPGVRLRLRDGDTTLLEVARPPLPAGPVVGPCAFRNAVVRAQLQLEAGVRLRFLGLDEGRRPAIEVGVRQGDRILPGGIYRVAVEDALVHAFPTTLAPRACRSIIASHGARAGQLRLHDDAATNVTLVHAVQHGSDDDTEVTTVLEDVLAACCVEEIGRRQPRRMTA